MSCDGVTPRPLGADAAWDDGMQLVHACTLSTPPRRDVEVRQAGG